jgi:hypothetical protein
MENMTMYMSTTGGDRKYFVRTPSCDLDYNYGRLHDVDYQHDSGGIELEE